MAQYTVKFSCGHTETVHLIGKHTDRERKIKWYEEQGCCSECRRELRMAEPIKARISYSIKENSYVVILSGHTYDRKDEIKANGFSWNGDNWVKYADSEESCIDIANSLDFEIDIEISTKIEERKKKAAEVAEFEAERQARIDEIKATKPEKPRCIADGRWNGNIYGSEKYGYNVYIDGNKRNLSPEEYDEIKQYEKDMKEYKERLNRV